MVVFLIGRILLYSLLSSYKTLVITVGGTEQEGNLGFFIEGNGINMISSALELGELFLLESSMRIKRIFSSTIIKSGLEQVFSLISDFFPFILSCILCNCLLESLDTVFVIANVADKDTHSIGTLPSNL